MAAAQRVPPVLCFRIRMTKSETSPNRELPQNGWGVVASLHLHPAQPGEPMLAVGQLTLVAGRGIQEDARYFDRPSRRKVSLLEREQLDEHAAVLGLESIPPGAARSNIETAGINLVELIGRDVRMGDAVLHVYAPRTPCHKMDAVAPGLRHLMEDGRQGVLATVVKSGIVRVGDVVRVL